MAYFIYYLNVLHAHVCSMTDDDRTMHSPVPVPIHCRTLSDVLVLRGYMWTSFFIFSHSRKTVGRSNHKQSSWRSSRRSGGASERSFPSTCAPSLKISSIKALALLDTWSYKFSAGTTSKQDDEILANHLSGLQLLRFKQTNAMSYLSSCMIIYHHHHHHTLIIIIISHSSSSSYASHQPLISHSSSATHHHHQPLTGHSAAIIITCHAHHAHSYEVVRTLRGTTKSVNRLWMSDPHACKQKDRMPKPLRETPKGPYRLSETHQHYSHVTIRASVNWINPSETKVNHSSWAKKSLSWTACSRSYAIWKLIMNFQTQEPINKSYPSVTLTVPN